MTDWSKRFQPKTQGGFHYRLVAEHDGYLFGFCEGWPRLWLSNSGICDKGTGLSCYDLIPIPPAEPIRRTVHLYTCANMEWVRFNTDDAPNISWKLIATAEVEFQPVDHD